MYEIQMCSEKCSAIEIFSGSLKRTPQNKSRITTYFALHSIVRFELTTKTSVRIKLKPDKI